MLKDVLIERLHDMEKVAEAFGIDPFDLYLLGGSACLLGDYTNRGTRHFDFVDQAYPAKYGKAFAMLRDFDMLDYRTSTIASGYKERAQKLEEISYLNIYVLSKEDIIVSKLIRLIDRDLEDISEMIKTADKTIINQLIANVLNRTDLFELKKEAFKEKLDFFREKFDV